MQRRVVWGACLSVLAFVLGGCAGAPSRGELVEALETSGIPTARAECAADAVIEELTDDEITEIVQRGPAGAPRDDPDSTDDASDRVRAALAECQQVGEEQAPTTTAPDTTTSSILDPTTTTAATAEEEPTSSTSQPG